jgi:hypothetical protein
MNLSQRKPIIDGIDDLKPNSRGPSLPIPKWVRACGYLCPPSAPEAGHRDSPVQDLSLLRIPLALRFGRQSRSRYHRFSYQCLLTKPWLAVLTYAAYTPGWDQNMPPSLTSASRGLCFAHLLLVVTLEWLMGGTDLAPEPDLPNVIP